VQLTQTFNSFKENIMNQNKKPTHHAYIVKETGEQTKDIWTKIGVAFAHNDSKGFSLLLDALPVDGKITLRIPEPKQS
jgi:hypothetical protein